MTRFAPPEQIMSNQPKSQMKRSRHGLRSIILATIVVMCIAAVVQVRSHFCWLYLYGWEAAILLAMPIWLWLFIFLVLRWLGRTVLLLITALALLAIPNYMHIGPRVSAALSTYWFLRQTNDALAAYKSGHPAEGFPTTAPVIKTPLLVQKFYRIVYTPARPHPGVPPDDYLLTASPTRCGCGLLSFATSGDGKIHSTDEDRQATLHDKIMGVGE